MTEPTPDRVRSPKIVIGVDFPTDATRLQNNQTNTSICNKSKQNAHDQNDAPEELGKLASKLNKKLTPKKFYTLVDLTRGRYELNELPKSSHAAAPLLNHLREYGASVILNQKPSADRLRR